MPASSGPSATPRDVAPADWAQTIQINLVGAYLCARAFLRRQDRGEADWEGVIVNLSSGAAHNALEGWSAYCASKAGLAMLTKSLHLEWAERGLRVYGFMPGTVDTRMQEAIRASGVNPVSRMARSDHRPAEDPASLVTFLCRPEAAAFAGQELSVRDEALRRAAGL